MDSEYDLKFQEMKMYIPFLEGMIKKLVSTGPGSANPRQAQLDKIRSLRDLLLNKKKRMKMENLLKCEQVLINLYAKVEQRDMIVKKAPDPGFSIDPPTPQEKSDLEAVRSKLKTVAKRHDDVQETLPEILRVDEVEEMHTAGSKEPALFQRRPNKSSISPTHRSPIKMKEEKLSSPSSASKRNYTRVLVSPDSSTRRWSTPDSAEDKPLFSRRSPRRSPRRYSPSYHKKERKKTLKESTARKSKDLNITLNVPEDSLSTLNTKDIFTRIINCKDGDVDIDTLRELRKQILTELKKTGARDDISDLILKSYSKKKAKSNKKRKEVEEGELSDSESEVIENVYGSLSGNLILKDKSDEQTSTNTDKARKIQICLVINSDKNKLVPNTSAKSEVLELEMYDNESKKVVESDSNKEKNEQGIKIIHNDDLKPITDVQKNTKEVDSTDEVTSKNNSSDVKLQTASKEKSEDCTQKEPVQNTANFYKPMKDSSKPVEANTIEVGKDAKQAQIETQIETDIKTDTKTETAVSVVPKTTKDVCLIEAELEKMEKPVEIPLLNEPVPKTPTPTNSTLSEIDILQALKNEILSESITIPGSESGTPLLHQPKINKVASAREIMPKKRISIENYKQKTDRDKTVSSMRFYRENDSKDDIVKKPSLKLTEKECERFNIQKKISFDDDSSDIDDGSEIQASDLYSDLAPKSPDRDESSNIESTPPVIIPGDPVKSVPVNRNADVDMRTLPILSPTQNNAPTSFSNISLLTNDTKSATKTDINPDKIKIQNKPVLFDPRARKDVNTSQSPSPHTANPDRTPRSAFSNMILSPASNASMTPNVRSYEVTPSHQSIDVDQSNKKHVYVPSFNMIDSKEGENSVSRDSKTVPSSENRKKSRFEDIGDTSSWSSSDVSINTRYTDSFTGDKYSQGQRTERYSLENRDCFSFKRSECPRTPLPSFGRSEGPVTTNQTFSRLDKPMTPLHSFGRAECPSTPIHHFGRSECPPTPSHPFGRLDCPSTPSHPFGRSDCPATPIHPFGSHAYNINELPLTPSYQFGATECPPTPYYGRNDCPTTPNHGFGRSDCPSTPSHPFGRSDFNAQKYTKDPRLNRKTEYESNSHLNERDRGYYKDSGYYRGSSYQSQKSFRGSDTYTSQNREQGKNSKYRYYASDFNGRQLSKDPRRELSGSSMPNDFENNRGFSRDRGQYNGEYEDAALRRGSQRERSIGRGVHPEHKRERSIGRNVHAENTLIRSSSRGPSIRNSPIEPKNNTLTVKYDAGHSFNIDTSVNETFQNFLESGKGIQVSESNFDARRQRAASVGRSLVQKSGYELVSDNAKRNTETRYKKDVFRRASSMGRDSADSVADKRSFQEIKADFETYKHPGKESSHFDTGKIRNIDTKSKSSNESIARSRREQEYYEKNKEEKRVQSCSKPNYSPKKNYRDPRMRKENNTKSKYKYEDPRAKKSGIVYSNDNIVKGAILASGYGVKNYKIPKIKRVVEEKQVEEPKKEKPANKKDEKEKDKQNNVEKRKDEEITIKEKVNDKSKDKIKVTPKQKNKEAPKEKFNSSPKNKNKAKNKEVSKEIDTTADNETENLLVQIDETSESDEQIGRRSTRLSRKLAVTNAVIEATAKTKKHKKSIISDSDSEMENSPSEILPQVADTDLRTTTPTDPPQISSPVKEKMLHKQPNAIDMHTNFGLELEMFTDNVVSDPVLDNINELIADLDNDLDATKSETSSNFTNEITLENMMKNITSLSSSSHDNLSESRDEFSQVLKAVDEMSKTNSNEAKTVVLKEFNNTEDSKSNKSKAAQSFDNLLASVKSSESVSIQNDAEEIKNDGNLNSNNLPLIRPTNEEIVSTTETDEDTLASEDKLIIDERSMDGCSTPDSTINIDVLGKTKTDDCVADSTNEEAHSETNVTSTDSVEPKPSLSDTGTDSDLALGNLLTMLQDKSNIKKLLSMLGDQSGDNDKIKKKLERLSEIVSDDEIEEKTVQPDLKSKAEVSVHTDDEKSNGNQTVHEVATKETESHLHDSDKTKLNKDDEEKNRNEIDDKTQFNENNENTPLNESNEKTPLIESNEKTPLNGNNLKTQFNENDENTQLNEDQEINGNPDKDESFEDLIGEDAIETEETDVQVTKPKNKKKMTNKKSKFSKKGKGRWPKKVTSIAEKRVTRATAAVVTLTKPKKPPRELQKLHDDIKEMFIRDDILSATGIRMCRLAKMVDEKPVSKEEVVLPEPEPVVVLEKFKKSPDKSSDNSIPEKVRKKPGPKPRPKPTVSSPEKQKQKYKPGPKSKTKYKKELDPYAFEPESVRDTTIENASEVDSDNSSDSEVCSLASSKSFGSTEVLAEIKKKNKRKRGRGWQDGVIKPKNKKKKLETKLETKLEPNVESDSNLDCYTDKEYCFRKNELIYSCRLCGFEGTNIVHHYISEHPHEEIPLSRMDPNQADEAIAQSKECNIPAIRKMPSEKYVCIFCFKEFAYNSSVLETFFWHIVSMHTGEYKRKCCECPPDKICPTSLDIPPPPKQTKGQLIGYICTRCNYTQLSLENLKNHVIKRHDDEQTPVYTINLSAMSRRTLKEFLRDKKILEPQVVHASSLQDVTVKLSEKPNDTVESNESESPLRKPASIKSKITFEVDDNVSELSDFTSEEPLVAKVIKIERVESENTDGFVNDEPRTIDTAKISQPTEVGYQPIQSTHQDVQQSSLDQRLENLAIQPSNDIVAYPHFKINITESGAKEYICCINAKDNHFKTTLLISMKKHVQLKHSEIWDGYCFICKVIVTPQGAHTFKDCFQHYLDKHMDNFPIYQKEMPESTAEEIPDKQVRQTDSPASSKSFINVRPISALISTAADDTPNETSSFPIIQSVVSLGAESPRINPTYPSVTKQKPPTEPIFKYEEAQAKVMSNKHRVVLETMMAPDKLVMVYKCAGRFCSFKCNSAEDALLHASTHQHIGGVDALNCSYCDFDAQGNAIDLVMHVFKVHGHCQYSCGQCFYRAAASQSVGDHASRVHGVAPSAATTLRTTLAPSAGDGGGMLTREQAVPYYCCRHAKGKCKYQSFTPNEFIEHLQQHVGASSHPCYICKEEASSPLDLVAHMASHGLNLFQCTWCVLGAGSEAELLAHTSAVHPNKQPQAYLRTITDKQRVLPLTYLNIIEVPVEDVTPSAVLDNPVREAERSIELEKLIGFIVMAEPQPEVSEPAAVHTEPARVHTEPLKDIIPEALKQQVAPIALVAPTLTVADLQPVPTAVASITAPITTDVTSQLPNHTPVAAVKSEPSLTITKVPFKAEPDAPAEPPSEVVVLDSDDEEPRPPVIDLSDDDATTSISKHAAPVQTTCQKVPLEVLSTCPKCRQVCKSINGLKKHFYYCYPNKSEGCQCAHCPYMASSRDNIMDHYMLDHCDKNNTSTTDIYQCGACRTNQASLSMVKRHLRDVHKERDTLVSVTVAKGIRYHVVNPTKKDKKDLPKRKYSTNNPETLSKRRFWPGEISQLPINPILEHLVYCEVCEFSTKVRLNMVRHLQAHAEQQPAPHTAPVNPVPHLETNEMHFDRMVNLASSSLGPDRHAPERADRPARAVPAPPERAARYPAPVPARQRNTCGGLGCSYTAVDEPTLRRHWEALHASAGSNAFRCVHCPASQTYDTSRPITAARVVQHLKMHDDTLYACPHCDAYHYTRDYLEKHMMEFHQNAPYYIVRESASAAAAAAAVAVTAATASASAAPTMDLKPWQCGFCEFKSMLRPEVAEHCFKLHQSKMQFRCGYCPFRASALENVNNHLAHSHPKEPEDVIYYYYREGSLPNGQDGTPRWMKQRQKVGPNLPQVKTEEQETPDEAPKTPLPPVNIDLKLVKKEVDESTVSESVESMEVLCKRFGQFCEPNGILFKCPLCNVISESTREAMQSHLYEELQYRKWGCGLCNYKAFHKPGLTEHMTTEHFRQYDHIELPTDVNKEKWVAGQLDHQAAIIEKHKANMANQKIVVERQNKPAPIAAFPTDDVVEKFSVQQLEEAFGEFGEPSNMMFCCPKCGTLLKDEAAMRDHLEMELNKIRWGCTNCSDKYQTYHEAQFHCKGHDGPSRPKEAVRDPSMRAAWLTYIIQAQKKTLQSLSATPTTSEASTPEKNYPEIENSLLVVRYEERVPTPDLVPVSRKRPAPESDDERLIIDEGAGSKKKIARVCPICPYKTKYFNTWKEHVLKHYNLKPYACRYCDYTCSYRQGIIAHNTRSHPDEDAKIIMNAIPPAKPYVHDLRKRPSIEQETMALHARKSKEGNCIICLFCENSIPDTDVDTHLHDDIKPEFARKGDVVLKCCVCRILRLNVNSLQEHYNVEHPHEPLNYALFKMHHDTRETHYCGHCEHTGFKFLRDLKSHHNAVHPTLLFKYTTVPYAYSESKKEKKKEEVPLLKRCARKSTTKLPGKTVAKKSTTRLPYSVPGTSDGYSYYMTKPEPLENYANVTTLMAICNTLMPVTLKKLSEIINIEPTVIVDDVRAGSSSDITFEK